MMGAIKGIGYILLAIVIVTLCIFGGVIFSVIGTFITIGVFGACVIGVVAIGIKEVLSPHDPPE